MIVRAQTASLWGVEAQPIAVEVSRSQGLPGVSLVGLARGATRESWVRVRAALGQVDVSVSTLHLIVNLVPADRPKDASTLELALAVAVMVAAGKVPRRALEERRFWGELGLDGRLEPSPGALLVADLSRSLGEREVLVPLADAPCAAHIGGVQVMGAAHLGEVLRHLTGLAPIARARPAAPAAACPPGSDAARLAAPCLADVVGQARAKRAVELAAAGGHNLLLVGPPGSGKTLLAQTLRRLLPPLDAAAQAEVLRVQAAVAATSNAQPTAPSALPPFRSPHHTSTPAALLGGGSQVRPGEVTLAHRGILFLDELPEFDRRALEALREPLEEGKIHVARAKASLTYPARVMLVAAMNPCPCGHFVPTGERTPRTPPCLCAFEQVQRYRARVSGPLLERIDLHVRVQAVSFAALRLAGATRASTETSAVVAKRVLAARARQAARLGPGRCNAEMTAAEGRAHAPLHASAQRAIEAAVDGGTLSMRALSRVAKIARTSADLRGDAWPHGEDVHEALSFVTGAQQRLAAQAGEGAG